MVVLSPSLYIICINAARTTKAQQLFPVLPRNVIVSKVANLVAIEPECFSSVKLELLAIKSHAGFEVLFAPLIQYQSS